MGGTVNISRSIWRDTAFKDEPHTEREAFMWIIMEASYKPREKRIGNITVSLERGQLATSVRFMCEAWGWSKSRVDRFLKRLENRDMIGTDSGTGINVITVCKYDEYQNKPKVIGTQEFTNRDSSGTATGQQRDKPNKGLIPDAIQSSSKRAKPERFQEFWDSYPHRGGSKKGRADSEKRYARHIAAGVSEQEIITAAIRYASDRQVLDGYAKNPATWLNQKGWEDEIEPVGRPAPSGNAGRGSPHDSLMAGFAQYANSDSGSGETSFHSQGPADYTSEQSVDCGPSGYPSQPILRVIGSN